MSTIGAHMIIRNGDIYDFPWREGILSVIEHVDEFVLLEAYSDKDDTYEECKKMARQHPKIRIIRDDWDGDEPEGHEYLRLSRLTNRCIEEVQSDWQWQIQGDECYHENELWEPLKVVRGKGRYGHNAKAIMVPFYHFVGNYSTTFPFVYGAAIRIARRNSSWRASGDAWNMEPSERDDNFVVSLGVCHCYHYGFTGDPFKRLEKEFFFQQMFRAHGFPDPKIIEMYEGGRPLDVSYLFQDAKDKGLFSPWYGTHPKVMEDWIREHRKFEAQL